MSRYINIGLMQYQIADNFEDNLKIIERNINTMNSGMTRPEIVIGPEMGIGLKVKDSIPGNITDRLGSIAKEYGIYLLPGSMVEKETIDGKEYLYNSLPIFGPDGNLIDTYRKICPYYPLESGITPGDKYVVLTIKEKNIKFGIMICHDWCFPEISRNLTLLGAEILIRPAIDPEGLYDSFKYVPVVRALENQAYFISLNTTGDNGDITAYGHTMIADPEGRIIYEAGNTETNYCITLDADIVTRNRKHGTFFTEQLVRQLKLFNIPMPFADKIDQAPVFKDLLDADTNMKSRAEKMKEIGLNNKLGVR